MTVSFCGGDFMALFGLFNKKHREVQEPFDMALSAIKKRKYTDAESILKANGIDPAVNHSDYKAYKEFFKYKIKWPEYITLPDVEIKAFIILYYLCGARTETLVKELKERTGIDAEFSLIHRAKRIIRSFDEIISGSELSAALNNGSSGLTMFYEIKSVKDGCVCEHCKELEGSKFLYADAVIGVNYPPFDCCTGEYCRCMALSKME